MKQKKLWTFWFVCLIVLVLVMTLLETLLVGYQQNEWQSRLAKSVVTLESRWNDKEEQRLQLEEVVVTRMVGLANVVASELLYDDQVNLSLLQQQLSVDDINIYSPRGIVLNSSHLPSVGYQVNEEHPVIRLFANEETMYFEPVREHLLKNEAMKFIYLQVGSKYVVQVGVLASQLGVYDFRYVLLEEVMKDQSALSWVWKQEDDECLFSSANVRVNNCTSLNRGREYMMVSLPATYGGDLWVEFNPKEFQSFFWKIRWIVYGMIGLFYLFYTVYMHMQNKKHNELMGDLYYDAMTRLPNHRYFFDIIKTMWSSDYSLLLLQIGKLNQINIIQGYAIGDDLIHRFVLHMTNNDQVRMIFRMSGDRFLLLTQTHRVEEVCHYAFQFEYVLHSQLIYDSMKHLAVAYIECNPKEDPLIHSKKLDITLRSIADFDQDRCRKYDEVMEMKLRREEIILFEIENAIRGNLPNLYIMMQPLFSTKELKTLGFEVLARFESDQFGHIPPTEFIDMAERNQLIIPLGTRLFELATEALVQLGQCGFGELFVSYNTSILQLMDPGFEAMLMNQLHITRLLPSQIEIEITETVFESNRKELVQRIERLRTLGFSIAIDDFGTGYSSLGLMMEMNVDQIKIDRKFIQSIISNPSKTIIPELMSIAKKAGAHVTAEGVEETVQVDYLTNLGCDILQGYGISKPLVYDDFVLFMQRD